MNKFTTAKPHDVVYNAKLGKGLVKLVTADKIVVQHVKGGATYTLDGDGVHGKLHWFENKS